MLEVVTTKKLPHRTKQRERLIDALVAIGGSISDSSGQATRKLLESTDLCHFYDSASEYGLSAFASFLKKCELDGLVKRSINGKRCYEISLATSLPENFHDLLAIEFESEDQIPADLPLEPETVDLTDTSAEVDHIDYELLAATLLNRAAEAIKLDPWSYEQRISQLEDQLANSRTRLNDLLQDNNRLRSKLDMANDELKANKTVIGGLRARLSEAELKISRMTKDHQLAIKAAVSEEARKQTRRLMQEAPRGLPE